MSTTLTPCQQHAADLAECKAARKQILLGGSITRLREGDKETQWSAPNLGLLEREIARLQALVDACNGVPRCGFPVFAPSDD